MDSPILESCINDLIEGIKDATLGSIESVVIDAAVQELILNWNDHLPEFLIDADVELKNWEKFKKA